ncbi:MAG: hypothetical protein KGS73_07155 [Chloroflexi bacterium]|nr:hypothetical protein [Chloroflexota bacterium]
MSSQSPLQRFQELQVTGKELVWVGVGVVAGLVLGLLVGWVFWPVNWQGGDIRSLGRDAQIEYLGDLADVSAGSPPATLGRFGDELPLLFEEAIQQAENGPDGPARSERLRALGSGWGVTGLAGAEVAGAEVATEASVGDSEPSNTGGTSWVVVAVLLLLGLLAVGTGATLLWRVFKDKLPSGPVVGPLLHPSASPVSFSGEEPDLSWQSSAAQAAATRVSPVRPPATGEVLPFEPEQPAEAARRPARPVLGPSVAVEAARAPLWSDESAFSKSPAVRETGGPGLKPVGAEGRSSAPGWQPAGRCIDQFDAEFIMGRQDFDWTRNIPGEQEDDYLGEYGIGISDRYGFLNNDPDQVVAIELYIFDKSDDKTLFNVSRVLLSEYADEHLRKHFEREKDRLGPVVAQRGLALQLESRQYILDCTITDVLYTDSGIFQRLTVHMELKQKR